MNMKKTNKCVGKMNNKGLAAIVVFTLITIAGGVIDNAIHPANAEPMETTIETAIVETTTTSMSTETTSMTTTSTSMFTTTSTTETDVTTMTSETIMLPSQEEQIIEIEVVENNEQPVVEKYEEKVVTSVQTTTAQTTTTTHQTTITETETEVTEEVETEEETNEVFDSSIEEVYLGNFRITGYVAGAGAKTASGTTPSATRTIAMNKTQFKNMGLKWGDKIRIEGIGTFILEDCGCKSGVIDVFRNSVSACYDLPPYADAYLVKE